jgi:hypothetical protein
MTCLDDPWYEGLLTKLFSLHVVDLCDSFCSARLVIEPLSGYGGSCLRATACSTAIERGGVLVAPVGPPSSGAVAADLSGVGLIRLSSVH